ncbi:PCC domain-containing protein [Bosea sp. (in: a-proteobacteria)]|uniref:PCC domain-containing protein n=1 Tax=Bosea sp. (in: a-proteobacteria) TaxID=1871050 RepID=UPI002FC6B6F5
MRSIAQPGPAPAERVQWAQGGGRQLVLDLKPGQLLLDAIGKAFAAQGFRSGVLRLPAGLPLAPFAYVMPALSATPEHAAFYSETFRPDGVTRIETGALTFGERDGASFFHGHALWREADGRRNGGHILPDQSFLAEAVQVEAVGIDGACFIAGHDPETNFKLFMPAEWPQAAPQAGGRFYALRLRPNQDVFTALESFCAERGIARAVIHGGVGSTIGARFAGGQIIEPFATEIAITSGSLAPGRSGALEAEITIALVDYTGGMAQGPLRRGDNPVLMTLELVLEAE